MLSKKPYLIILIFISSLYAMEDPSCSVSSIAKNKSRNELPAVGSVTIVDLSEQRFSFESKEESNEESFTQIDLQNQNRALIQLQDEQINSMQSEIQFLQEELQDSNLSKYYEGAVRFCHYRNTKLNFKLVKQVIKHAPHHLKTIIKVLNHRDESTNRLVTLCVPSCIVLSGKCGVGKSVLAKSIALYCGIEHIFIKCIDLHNEFKDSGSNNLNKILTSFLDMDEPFIIILDELHTFIKKKNNNYSDIDAAQILRSFLDACVEKQNILIIATSNNMDDLPDQLKSRISDCIFNIELPNFNQRKRMIKYYLRNIPTGIISGLLKDDVITIANLTKGLSNRDIEKIIEYSIRLAYLHGFDIADHDHCVILTLSNIKEAYLDIKKNNETKLWYKAYDFIKPAIYPTLTFGVPVLATLIYSLRQPR